jgi:hypothetical protein
MIPAIVQSNGNYRWTGSTHRNRQLQVALSKALPALASVIVRCDENVSDFSIHCNAVTGLHEVRPDTLCSSRVGLRVSVGRIRTPTIMLCFLPSNDCTTLAQRPGCAHPFHAFDAASVAFEAVIRVTSHRGLKRRGCVVEMSMSCDALEPFADTDRCRRINA